jgi:hypothetical protein
MSTRAATFERGRPAQSFRSTRWGYQERLPI